MAPPHAAGAPRAAAVTARITGLDQEGRGVARVDGKVTFVEGALPGETVLCRPRKRRRRHDEAQCLEVIEPSPDRVVPACPHFERCGGCTLQHLSHPAQIEARQAMLLEALRTVGGVEPGSVAPPVYAPPWGYRRRARLGVKHVPAKGGVLVGFRERHSPSKVAEIEHCAVLAPAAGERIAALRELIGRLEVRARVPQIEVAAGDESLALVVRHLDPLCEADGRALAEFADAEGITVLVQPGGPDTVAGLAPRDPPALTYALPAHGVTLQFRPTDFVQVNGPVNRALVDRALELLALRPGDRVLDLFCGLGNFTLPLARAGAEVTGLEGLPGLVEQARANAALNGLADVPFEVADLADAAVASAWLARPWDALLLDPPRTGAAAVIDALHPPYPERVVYVSCNPGTLARDAGRLVGDHGYRLSSAGIVDMFPHTRHVESVALFERS